MSNDNAPEAVAGLEHGPPTVEQLVEAMAGTSLTGGADFRKRDLDRHLPGPFVAVHFPPGSEEEAVRLGHMLQALWAATGHDPDEGVVIGVQRP